MTSPTHSKPPPPIEQGTPGYVRLAAGAAGAGFSIFVILYGPQPLLPAIGQAFRQDAAGASLAVSAATLGLAMGLIPAGFLADRIGRKLAIVGAILLATLFTLASAVAREWPLFVALRFLSGAALAGAPAASMAMIGEELAPAAAGSAMGLYIGSTALGGMAGRLGAGLAAEWLGWRGALLATGALGLIVSAAVLLALPRARRFQPSAGTLAAMGPALREVLRRPAIGWLCLEAFLLMGAFVTVYNYAGFRLSAPPYSLNQAQVGAVFALYLLGSVGSALFGARAGRIGHAATFVLPVGLLLAGCALTLLQPLWALIAALGLLTFGFFGAHAVGSAWIGRASGARRAQGAALYLVAYYVGSSLMGWLGGFLWEGAGWGGVAAFVTALSGAALLVAFRLKAEANRASP